jgi:hypothetical protein
VTEGGTKTVRVEIEHADGTIVRLTGSAAQKWGEYIRSTDGYLHVHGVTAPVFKWEEFHRVASTR